VGMYETSSALRSTKTQYRARYNIPYSDEIVDVFRARYDEYIRYCDRQFEDFMRQLRNRAVSDKSIVILSSDHGEIFNRQYISHGWSLYEPETNIPLIIKESDTRKGLIINEIVDQIDITPTIMDLAEVPIPSWIEGRSLVPVMRGERLPSSPAFSMALHKNRSLGHKIEKGDIAVWKDHFKLIYSIDNGKSQLFNLKEDPDELNNLFDKEPEVGKHLLSLIQANLKKANEKISN